MYKVSYNLIFFPIIYDPLPFPPLDILPNSPDIIRKMMLLPLSILSMSTAMIPLSLLIFFPNKFDKIPPPLEGGYGTLHTPV